MIHPVAKARKKKVVGPCDLQIALGSAIRAERLRLGVTQEELAWRASLHRTYLANIERGGRNLTLRVISNLARALEVSVRDLLCFPGDDVIPRGLGTVLLVEDNAVDAELTMLALQRANFRNPVKVAATGREALDYLKCEGRFSMRTPAIPQLILLDLNLPDLSGMKVMKEVKANVHLRNIPIIVLTYSKTDKNITECARLGADGYIIKPVEIDNLSRATAKLDLQWALLNKRIAKPERQLPPAQPCLMPT